MFKTTPGPAAPKLIHAEAVQGTLSEDNYNKHRNCRGKLTRLARGDSFPDEIYYSCSSCDTVVITGGPDGLTTITARSFSDHYDIIDGKAVFFRDY